jgi:prepilin-type N-terminal cleavage/methylation domain-containing protein
MQRHKTKPVDGFTLIEVLAVVVVIGILLGVMLKVGSLLSDRTGRAATASRLENLKMCLKEYYRVNGQYPPSAPGHGTGYESPDDGVYPASWNLISTYGRQTDPLFNDWNNGQTGLVYYLMPAGVPNSAGQDFSFRNPSGARWKEYFDGAGYSSARAMHSNLVTTGWHYSLTNDYPHLEDAYWQEFYYESLPPYQAFRLHSRGKDGLDATGDDIGRDEMTQ